MQSQTLIPYRKGNNWGYASRSLKVIIKPKYEAVGYFYGNISWVKKKKKYAFINKQGEIITPFKYDYIGKYNYGTFNVKINDSTYCVNSKLEKVKCIYYGGCGTKGKQICIHFTYSLNNKIGLVLDYYDDKGVTYDTLPAIWTNFISNENCLFAVRNDSLWGFAVRVDSNVNLIINYQFEKVKKQFHSDYFTIINDNRYGFVSSDGSVVVYPKYEKLNDFTDYFVTKAYIDNSFWFYVDIKGNEYYKKNIWVKLKHFLRKNIE